MCHKRRKMPRIIIFLFGFLLWFTAAGYGQSSYCTLGLGGKDTEVILQVFQLNAEQQEQTDAWVAEYRIRARLIQEGADSLLTAHPQKTPEDLQQLALKYNILRNELVELSEGYDRKLIAIFNEKQYALYLKLCEEVNRRPFSSIIREHR